MDIMSPKDNSTSYFPISCIQ